MKVDKQKYVDNYHEKGKFKDNWQQGIKLLPFSTQSASSAFDKRCSLQGTIGAFVRLVDPDGAMPIDNFEQSVLEPVSAYLKKKRMEDGQIQEFLKVVRDVFWVNGNLNIADASFFKFIPLVSEDSRVTDAEKKKYSDGQRKMAEYLRAMLLVPVKFGSNGSQNYFLKVIADALAERMFDDGRKTPVAKEYVVPSYIAKSFTEDLHWLLNESEQVQVKYLHLFLHFYACYSITQAIFLFSSDKNDGEAASRPEKLYFILASEKTSMTHDAVLYGWASKIQQKKILEKLFGRMQALDIANSILGGDKGFYPEVLEELKKTPFEENQEVLKEILVEYVSEKTKLLKERTTEKEQTVRDFNPDITSYEEFLRQLEKCCVELQSVSYVARFKKKVMDVMNVRFLQSRKGNHVLVLDNEMLTFLIALVTKGQKVKLEEMYQRFNDYGIYFNRETRSAIEEYLLKMNLLDRKSDSGEVQYVRAVL